MEAGEDRVGPIRERFVAGEGGPQGGPDTPAAPIIANLRRALRHDLDAPRALAEVDEWTSAVLAGDGSDPDAPRQVADAVDALLGVRFG